MPSRRDFLHWAGAGAALSLAANRVGSAQEPAKSTAAETKPRERTAIPFELGVASYTFRGFPLDQMLAMTARVGIKNICLKDKFHLPLDAKPETIAQAWTRMRALDLNYYGSGVTFMPNAEVVKLAFDYARAARMKAIVGVAPPELLPLVSERTKEYDIRVAIHNHGPEDKMYPEPTVIYEKVKGLDPRVGICIDIGHTVRAGKDLNSVTEQVADRLLDVHIKDLADTSPTGKDVEVGRGVLDIPGFLRTLVKINYKYIVAFEYEKDCNDPLPGLAESVGYVRGVLAAI